MPPEAPGPFAYLSTVQRMGRGKMTALGHVREYGVLICRVRCSPDIRPELPAPNPPWWHPGSSSPLLHRTVCVIPLSAGLGTARPRAIAARFRGVRPSDRVKRKFFLDWRPPGAYIHVMFYFGQEERCVCLRQGFGGQARRSFSGGGEAGRGSGGGGRVRRSLGEGGKNVYFCFGKKYNLFKALYGIHVYFCIPA